MTGGQVRLVYYTRPEKNIKYKKTKTQKNSSVENEYCCLSKNNKFQALPQNSYI